MDKKINITIRKASVSDLSILQSLGTELMDSDMRFDPAFLRKWYNTENGKKYLLKRIRGKKGICFIAEVGNQAVGYLTGYLAEFETWRPFHRAQIDNIYVKGEYRSKGIGTELIKIFVKWSKTKRAEKIILLTESKNIEGIKFYQKNNFNPLLFLMEAEI